MPAFDQLAQRPFFSETGWLFDRAFHKAHKALLYTGPKGLLIGLVALALVAAVLVWRRGKNFENAHRWRNALLLLALSIALVPLLNATIKKLTGVYSPVDLIPYGGTHEHIGFLEHIRLHGGVGDGASFPAGHASGGFALMALYFLPLRKYLRFVLLGAGVLAGWLMGLYQMARGEHFLTHTLTTAFISWALILLLARLLGLRNRL